MHCLSNLVLHLKFVFAGDLWDFDPDSGEAQLHVWQGHHVLRHGPIRRQLDLLCEFMGLRITQEGGLRRFGFRFSGTTLTPYRRGESL